MWRKISSAFRKLCEMQVLNLWNWLLDLCFFTLKLNVSKLELLASIILQFLVSTRQNLLQGRSMCHSHKPNRPVAPGRRRKLTLLIGPFLVCVLSVSIFSKEETVRYSQPSVNLKTILPCFCIAGVIKVTDKLWKKYVTAARSERQKFSLFFACEKIMMGLEYFKS